MWRPFASDFVSHTFDEYKKKLDRAWANNPPVQPAKANSAQFPYQFEHEEEVKRLNEFALLQVKVNEQRKLIKRRDLMAEHYLKQKIKEQNEASEMIKIEKKMNLDRVRGMASNKIKRFRLRRSLDSEPGYADPMFYRTAEVVRKHSLYGIGSTS